MADPTPEVVSIDGEEFYQWKVVLRIPKNWTPESGVFIAVAPPGGIANFPAAVQGSPGLPITIRNSTVVPLDPDDPTDDTLVWDLITPGTATTQPVYDVTLTIHRGAKGDDGTLTILDATDFEAGTEGDADAYLQDGYILQLVSDGEGGFTVRPVAFKIGNMYWPSATADLTNASGANALNQVTIPTQLGPYRVCVDGQQEISPDGPDIKVDLVARLGGTGTGTGATDGNVIARGQGVAGGADQNLIFSPSPPVASAPGFGEVSDGASRVIYIRLEQIGSGADTVDTVSGRGFYSVRVEPLP